MKNAVVSFVLVVLIEAVSAVVAYLKAQLMGNLSRADDGPDYADR
ncbi:hypothetical protein [Burkholderia sp. Ed8]